MCSSELESSSKLRGQSEPFGVMFGKWKEISFVVHKVKRESVYVILSVTTRLLAYLVHLSSYFLSCTTFPHLSFKMRICIVIYLIYSVLTLKI